MSDAGETVTVGKRETLDALHRLYVESLCDEERHLYERSPITTAPHLKLDDACDALAGSRWVNRMQRWDAVFTAVRRRPELFDEERTKLMAYVLSGAKPGTDQNQRVAGALRALRAERQPPFSWHDFLEIVIEPELPADRGLRDAERSRPSCNDEPDPVDGTPTIVAQFWTSTDFDRLVDVVDPRNWARLGSLYWEEMEQEGPLRPTTSGFTGIFREKVRLLPDLTITVYLGVRYSRTDGTVLTEFWTAAPPGKRNSDVRIDEGCVLVTKETVSPDGLPYRMYTTKSILFEREELNEFTGLACDNGWIDLLMAMASGGLTEDPVEPPRQPSPADGSEPTEQWAGAAKGVVDQQVALVRRSGDALRRGQWADQLDGALAVGSGIVDMWTAGAKAWREWLRDVGTVDRA